MIECMANTMHQVPSTTIEDDDRRAALEVTYREKVANAYVFNLPLIAPWISPTCPECGEDLDTMEPAQFNRHTVLANAVVIACEDYWVINPNAVGIEDPTWWDWRPCANGGLPLKDDPDTGVVVARIE